MYKPGGYFGRRKFQLSEKLKDVLAPERNIEIKLLNEKKKRRQRYIIKMVMIEKEEQIRKDKDLAIDEDDYFEALKKILLIDMHLMKLHLDIEHFEGYEQMEEEYNSSIEDFQYWRDNLEHFIIEYMESMEKQIGRKQTICLALRSLFENKQNIKKHEFLRGKL